MADPAPQPPRAAGPLTWAQEHALALLGAVAGGLLIAIAWSPAFDRKAEVEREFQLITRGVEVAIQRDWEAESWRPSQSPLEHVDANSLALPTRFATSVDWDVRGVTRSQVFEAYLSESERAETEQRWSSALADLRRAAEHTDDPRRLTLLDLRMVQVGSKAQDLAAVTEALQRLADRLDGSERSGQRPILGNALIAASAAEGDTAQRPAESIDAWETAQRTAESKLVSALQANRLALELPVEYSLEFDPVSANTVVQLRPAPLRRVYWDSLEQAVSASTQTAIQAQRQAELRDWLQRRFGWRTQTRVASLFAANDGSEHLLYSVPSDDDGFDLWILNRESVQRGLLKAWAQDDLVPDGYRVVFTDPFADGNTELGRPLRGLPWNVRAIADEGMRARQLARDPYRLFRVVLHAFGVICVLAGFGMQRQRNRERAIQQLKSDFVANVSHELRTPLSSILLMAENLTAGRASDKNRNRYHELILREAQRLRRLVDDVLDFTRIDRGEGPRLRVERTSLGQFSASLAGDLELWSKQHGMEVQVTAQVNESRGVELDPESIRRAVLNLVDNARRHSESSRVDVEVTDSATHFTIAVRDFGKGLPEEALESVFQPFQQLQSESTQGKGAGLGLAIVTEIAQAHGGKIRAESPADGGARFILTVPLEQTHEEPTHPTR